tara:strand:- start:6 stop:572 length:567 start_codon:yes stop_codon:yes gene_type:complete
MNYGKLYQIAEFKDETVDKINEIISSTKLTWETALIQDSKLSSTRKTEVAWLDDPELLKGMLFMAEEINKSAGWNLDIDSVEPIQLGHYPEGHYYDWHLDQHNKITNPKGTVRKISMSYMLNDDYEGGELDIEIRQPGDKGGRPRYDTFKPMPGVGVFFESTAYHRVRPVTQGTRKSLVAWFNGPPYK